MVYLYWWKKGCRCSLTQATATCMRMEADRRCLRRARTVLVDSPSVLGRSIRRSSTPIPPSSICSPVLKTPCSRNCGEGREYINKKWWTIEWMNFYNSHYIWTSRTCNISVKLALIMIQYSSAKQQTDMHLFLVISHCIIVKKHWTFSLGFNDCSTVKIQVNKLNCCLNT